LRKSSSGWKIVKEFIRRMTQIISQHSMLALVTMSRRAVSLFPQAPLNDCFAPPPPESQRPCDDLQQARPHPLLRIIPLDAGYGAAFVPSASQVVVLDGAAQQLLQRLPLGATRADIATIEAIEQLWAAGLLTNSGAPLSPPAETQTLTAWLHVTNACNLRCTYCYIAKSQETMDPATGRRAVDALIRSALAHGYPEIMIKYGGGEPSLALDTVAAIQDYAAERTNHYGLRLSSGLLSNGAALTPARLATIRSLGLRLMISLDGLAATHDNQRPTIGGRGSAHMALRGIEDARAAGVPPEIAITVTGRSVHGLPDLLNWLLTRDLQFGISFYRDHSCGAATPDLRFEEQELIEGMRAAYRTIAQNPPRWSVLSALLDRNDLAAGHARACGAGHSYIVIDQHGRVAKCQTELATPITTIDAPDPLQLIRGDPRSVQGLRVEAKAGCRTCEWRYWCAGGCPIATFRATGRFDLQSPNCAIYKALYPDLVRLEGQRLLHWFRAAQQDLPNN
jgi:uncharacterized protein